MSGTYEVENQTAPGGLGDTASTVQALVASSARVTDAQQADAGRFIRENGHDVVSGHADVGQPRD